MLFQVHRCQTWPNSVSRSQGKLLMYSVWSVYEDEKNCIDQTDSQRMYISQAFSQAKNWRYKRILTGSWKLNLVGIKGVVGNETEVVGCDAKIEPFMLIQCLNFTGVIEFASSKENCHQCRI